MDPTLLFRVLVVAKGFEPAFFTKVDPRKGTLDARLKARAARTMPVSQIVTGRVLAPDKKSVANAVVSVEETVTGNTTHGSPLEGADPLAITDESGQFEIRSPQKFDAVNVKVEARGFARRRFNGVRPGPSPTELVVTPGAALTGRVMSGSKPVGNIAIGAAQTDRRAGGPFVGAFVTGTDEDGRFCFPNVPPDNEYAVYGLMDSLKGRGALPTRLFRVKGDGSSNDMGTLEFTTGWRLAGQVTLSDSKPIPAHTRLVIGRDTAWDSGSAELPPDGRFSLSNVPGEMLDLSARINGYRLSDKNASLDRYNPFRLIGQLASDTTNLVILLEPGDNLPFGRNRSGPDPRDLPLGGIESKQAK